MVHGSLPSRTPPSTLIPGRALAEQVFSRAAGAPLIGGNSIRLLIDADFVGMSSYVQALRSAAMDGVDIRLLVPGSTDIPVLRAVSRSGYQPLLEAGVRVFEWNGPMMHAKTAVADGLWARVGSTNLNIASWMGNCELDVAVEDAMQGKESAGILDAIPQPWHPPGLKGSFGFYSFASWAIYTPFKIVSSWLFICPERRSMQIRSIATHQRICRGKGIHRDCRVYDEPENIQMKGGD